MKKTEYIYEKEKRPIPWERIIKLSMLFLSLAAIIAASVFLFQLRHRRSMEKQFDRALQDLDYASALKVYHEVQSKSTDLGLKAEERGYYREIQNKMETAVNDRMDAILSNVLAGSPLTPEETAFTEGLNELTAAHVTPDFKKRTEEFLDGKLSREAWHHYISSFSELKNLAMICRGFLEQEDCLAEKSSAFVEAGLNEEGEDWQLAWNSWQNLAEDKDSCRFAREYAGFRLSSYQEREYSRLMETAQALIEAERFYTAKELLERMYKVFPESKELLERLQLCEQKVPKNLLRWRNTVDVLAVRPLVVRNELAFAKSGDPTYAENSLLSAGEFKNVLESLYRQNYVLISPKQIQDWPKKRVEIVVPEGKKPLMLIFDRWQYSVLNQVCGTAEKLAVTPEGGLTAYAGGKSDRNNDAITILEDFISAHPDFSFDGAKAVIALNGYESVFGYVCDENELDAVKQAWRRVGQKFPDLNDEDILQQREEVSKIFAYLKKHGWDFASCGYRGFDSGTLSLDELKEEIDKWSYLMSPWINDCVIYVFPNGSHVYQKPDSLEYMLSRGFRVFFGAGPKPYHFYADRYVHFDRVPLNGNTLRTAQWNLSRLFGMDSILDRGLRGY